MSVEVTYESKVTVAKTLTDTLANSSRKTVTVSGLNTTTTLNAGSTPAATDVAVMSKTMTSGAGTIDLRSLTGVNGAPIDGNTKKVRIFKVIAKAGNANPITIRPGASSGYNIFGASSSITLNPGEEALFKFGASAVTIDATHKTIDLFGTGSQGVDVEIVIG